MLTHLGTKTIETDRLILRPFVLEDADAMYKNWASDSEVAKYLTWIAHTNVAVTRSVIEMWVKSYSSKKVYNWSITLQNNKTEGVIGNIGVIDMNEDLQKAEIGYCLSRKYWHHGIMSEALKNVLNYLFECGFMRIYAHHDTLNPNSGKVMKKCSMTFEGITRKADKNNVGEFCDMAQYAILKTDPR